MSTVYLHGVDRTLVNRLWRIKQAAKEAGRKDVSILSVLNDLLAESLPESRVATLTAVYTAPKEEPRETEVA